MTLALAAAVLGGCATPAQIGAGMPQSQVVERLGAPVARHALPGGGERLEYGSDPLQQTTWMVDVGPDGRVVRVRQVRTMENFARLRVGIDDAAVVRRELGTPWRIERYPLSKLTAWMYPYRENEVWNSMMAVHFDDRGVVQRLENGPDPRFLGGGNRDD
jgi:outer membrane protein assembly factor BamE (lipoprotein component of BamABCDE complex)